MTGQTGSGQARLTLGGSIRRCPRDWNGAPLSGSHLGPHTRPQRPCNKAVSREAVCSFVHTLQRRLQSLQPHQSRIGIGTEVINDEYEFSLTEREVPLKG
jgi:hypothetical protein